MPPMPPIPPTPPIGGNLKKKRIRFNNKLQIENLCLE